MLYTRDVFAVAGVTAGAPPEWVLCLQVPWDTLHPEPRLRLQKTDLECSVCVFTDGETCLSQWEGWDDKTELSPQGLLQVSSHLCTPKVLQIWKGTVRIGKS